MNSADAVILTQMIVQNQQSCMKKDLLMICLSLALLVAGCFSGRSNPASVATDTKPEILPPAATAEVSIRLRLHNESLRAAFRAQTTANAVFSLKLINRGNLNNPITLMRKTVPVVGGTNAADGTATVSFSAVPAVPVLAVLELEGAGIYSGATKYQVFHGGADLLPGQNNEVVIVASGSAEPEDVVAGAALLSIADFSTMTGVSAALFTNLNEVFAAAAPADKLLAEKIFTTFKSRILGAKLLAVTGGTVHSLALRDDGTLVGFGNNADGQLAVPNLQETYYAKFSPFTRRVKAIAAGDDFSLLLCENSKVYACGANDQTQLGSLGAVSTAYPLEVTGLSNITAVAAGYQHALAIDSGGQLYVWGANNRGQLGLGNTSTVGVTAQAVSGLTGVKAVAAGNNFSLIIKGDNTVWAAGDNSMVQLSNDTMEYSASFVQINLPVAASAIAAGDGHCLAIGIDGNVFAWGFNSFGQTGLASTSVVINAPGRIAGLTAAEKVFAGANHSLVTTSGGSVYVFGDNLNGQLGRPFTTIKAISPFLSTNLTAVTAAGCGAENSYAVFSGKGYAVGDNSAGQIGNGLTDASAETEGVPTPSEINLASPWN